MRSHGRQYFLQYYLSVTFVVTMFSLIFTIISAQASSFTVRDIQIKDRQIEIQLDGTVDSSAVQIDYVRDIVQFSIQNATLYPARILHAEGQSFTKVFAYQYAPNYVRIRFSVQGPADSYRGKIQWRSKGKMLWVSFPDQKTILAEKASTIKEVTTAKAATAKDRIEKETQTEAVLLQKVLQEKITEKKEEKRAERKLEKKADKITLAKPESKKLENEAVLGGAPRGTSVLRSLLAMVLIVGGLGMVLFYVRKKQKGIQAKRVGTSWFSQLLPQAMRKQKSFIEVLGQHALGPKQSLVVVRIRGQQFILGVTQDHVQLISQIDADESEVDILGDPAVAASLDKMFGAKGEKEKAQEKIQLKNTQPELKSIQPAFQTLLKNGLQENALQENALPVKQGFQSGIREQIRHRLEAMKNV